MVPKRSCNTSDENQAQASITVSSGLALGLYGMVGAALSSVFFRLGRRWRDPARERAFRALWASQWWAYDRLKADQWSRLQRLLHHAYEHVPYYRDVFQSLGARPEDFREPSDLGRLPLLTKDIVQSSGEQLRATAGYDARGVYENHTGGSTGTPLTFSQDTSYRAWGMGELDRNYWMCGYRPGQRQAFFWGSDYESKAHKSLGGKLRDLMLNLRWIDAFDLNQDKLRQALVELILFKPHLMVGYVSSLTLLAQLIEEQQLPAPHPRAVQTSAEVLTPAARERIERALGAKCFDRYGCREVGNIAHECEAHAGLHLLMENNYTEFVADNGTATPPGTPGQIVVTNLRNYVMPFIRYATADVGVPSARHCECGRGLPLMEAVQGRISDVIVTPSGRLLHGEFFTHLFYGVTGIRQFQVEQLTLTDLVVRLVAESDGVYESARSRLEGLIAHYGDSRFRLTFSRVTRIPPRKSGKYCFTLSQVPVSFVKGRQNAVAR